MKAHRRGDALLAGKMRDRNSHILNIITQSAALQGIVNAFARSRKQGGRKVGGFRRVHDDFIALPARGRGNAHPHFAVVHDVAEFTLKHGCRLALRGGGFLANHHWLPGAWGNAIFALNAVKKHLKMQLAHARDIALPAGFVHFQA